MKFNTNNGLKKFTSLSKREKVSVVGGIVVFLIILFTILTFKVIDVVEEREAIIEEQKIEASALNKETGFGANTEAFPKEEILTTYSNRAAKYPSHPLYIEANENTCLALNIYYEARNQSVEGQYAVAFVTLNRLQLPQFPDNVCDVVYQKSWNKAKRKFIAQFSWTTCERCVKPKDKKRFELANTIAKNVMKFYGTNMLDDPTFGSTHYHATYVKPRWRLTFEKTVQIGDHIFYRMKNVDSVAYFIKRSKQKPEIDSKK